MNGLYSEGQVKKVSEAMRNSGQAIGVTIGSIAGSLVISIITRRRKENGRTPRKKLIERGVQKAISELMEIAETSGIQGLGEDTIKQAADTALQLTNKQFGGGQQGGQQGPPRQVNPQQPPQQNQQPMVS